MKCIKERCYSPIACGGFGYCRELNFEPCPECNDSGFSGCGSGHGDVCGTCGGQSRTRDLTGGEQGVAT